MDVVIIYKQDGTVQCDPTIKGRPLIHDDALLKKLGVAEAHGLQSIPGPRRVAQVCFTLTDRVNVFAIPLADWEILKTQIVDGLGFALWADAPLPDINLPADCRVRVTGLPELKYTSFASQPILIREIIGRPLRCYALGDPVSEDFVPERVNIVQEDGKTLRIWFG